MNRHPLPPPQGAKTEQKYSAFLKFRSKVYDQAIPMCVHVFIAVILILLLIHP